jgi:hypothetical protein
MTQLVRTFEEMKGFAVVLVLSLIAGVIGQTPEQDACFRSFNARNPIAGDAIDENCAGVLDFAAVRKENVPS